MKRAASFFVVIILLITCTGAISACAGLNRYSYTFLGAFDTSVTITAFCKNESDFEKLCTTVEAEMLSYHRYFDIYNTYEGITNLKSINDNAGKGAVEAAQEIIDLLNFGISMHSYSEGRLNIMFGAVLSIWHEYRENGINSPDSAVLPERSELLRASEHCDIGSLIVDSEAGTVEITDEQASIDVGAIAKGFAVERVCDTLMELGYDGVLINAGGNIGTIGTKPGGEEWNTAVQNPFVIYENLSGADAIPSGVTGSENITYKSIAGQSLVTSGDYQRYYTVDGIRYHHIIDPETLFPADYVKSVTVCVGSSELADALSTMLFLMPPDEAIEFAEGSDSIDLEVFIVKATGETLSTQGW
ncbi:MAG: FAD:protein FMN transferase [Christensenellaceae bacterium]|nr:FAD:protein FMN transferase [Christensenellaceae bacterium]